MEYRELIELIKTVSDSNISDFQYEHGDTRIVMCQGESAAAVCEPKMTQVRPQMPTEVAEEASSQETAGSLVTAPLVGTFYAAPAEDAAPFVTVGDAVKCGQTLAIVEAMKLMNEIESEYDGVVSKVFVKNGEMVEYGQPLFEVSVC